MTTSHYVGRVHNEDVFEILKKAREYSFDQDSEMLSRPLHAVDLDRLKRARSSFLLMRDCKPGAVVLFLGTTHWKDREVSGRTVLGYGITKKDPYRFEKSTDYWRHRLKMEEIIWAAPHTTLNGLGITKNVTRSRFFRDWQGVVKQAFQNISPPRGTDSNPPITETTDPFQFKPGCSTKPERTKAALAERELDVSLRENEIQLALHKHLVDLYGSNAVGTECPSGSGGKIDVVVHRGTRFWFYEIKTADSARACIREALAQLLEYSFWPGAHEAERLIVVGEPLLDAQSQVYLTRLRKKFSLPIHYDQFDVAKGTLVNTA
jgi:hypothetical protein